MKNNRYNPVNEDIFRKLSKIVGENYVIFGDKEKLEPFSHDETPGKQYAHMPEIVVRPESALQISEIMKLANREMIPVTPRGAGSGLSGGAVPVHGGIVLSTDRMNRILELDRKNMMIVLEPGVIANDINEYIREYKLFYAGYPMSLETCFIGGNIAENAGGGKAVKYGVTSRYVLGLELVMPTGEIVEFGGKLVKDVTGYNLVPLMAGSEGTLGIITRVVLKLMPLPGENVDLLCLFEDSAIAINTVSMILSSPVDVASIEFMDSESVKAACGYLNETIPYDKCGAMLLITLDGSDREKVEEDYERAGELCMEAGALEVYVADNATTSERIWKVRRNIAEAYNAETDRQTNEDIVVPPASISVMVEKFRQLSQKYGLKIPCYGHAGDGNLHTRIIPPREMPDSDWEKTIPVVLDELYSIVKEQGGRISGEHGIGHKRKKYMKSVVSEEYINILRKVKSAFDPNNILNPGKIFETGS